MTGYQWLGISSIALLVMAIGLSVYILIGHHPKERVFLIARIVLGMIITVSVMAGIIWQEFAP